MYYRPDPEFLAKGAVPDVEALGRIIIGGPYLPSNVIIYMHLQL